MTVLKENEIAVPEGVDVKVVENTDTTVHLILPPAPSSDELSDEQVNALAGGYKDISILTM